MQDADAYGEVRRCEAVLSVRARSMESVERVLSQLQVLQFEHMLGCCQAHPRTGPAPDWFVDCQERYM